MIENSVMHGDCLDILPELDAASVDLCYMDPPFMSGRDFGEFDDRFDTMDEYIGFIRERVEQIKRVLKNDGSFYLHCDTSASHYIKIMLDSVFGTGKFMCEVIWKRTGGHYDSKTYAKTTDRILVYADRLHADQIRQPPSDDLIKRKYTMSDERGKYQPVGLSGESLAGGGYRYEYNGHEREWNCPKKTMLRYEKENRLHIPASGIPYRKAYLHEHRGLMPTDLWNDISRINGMAKEKTGYPTQKPLELLQRVVQASSKEGDLVLDPFCGSGTTLVAAKSLNRNYIGIDINPDAIKLAEKRLDETDIKENETSKQNPFLKTRE